MVAQHEAGSILTVDARAREVLGNGTAEAALRQLEEVLRQAGGNGSRFRLLVESPAEYAEAAPQPAAERRPTYGHVSDDMAQQFDGGINNREHGLPIWE